MERTLEVACAGTASNFAVRKLSRATLYGTRRRVPVDAEGRPCRAAALTRDGRFLLPPGSTATLYLDDQGDAVERGGLRSMGGGQDGASAREARVAEAAELLDCTVRQDDALARWHRRPACVFHRPEARATGALPGEERRGLLPARRVGHQLRASRAGAG